MGVEQSFSEREGAESGIEQRLERVRQRAAQQFYGSGVDQRSKDRGPAVPPPGLESIERGGGTSVFPNGQVAVCRLVGSELPVPEPVVHSGQAVWIVELSGQYRGDPQREHVAVAVLGQPLERLGDR